VPETCDRLDNDCDGTDDDDRICEREELAYTTPLEEPAGDSDLDGDGRADACAWLPREGTSGASLERVHCALSSAHGWNESLALGGVLAGGVRADSVIASSALRTADVDGDGRADVCVRHEGRLVCALARGRSFGELVLGPAWTEDLPLWLADVDGDGAADVCLRRAEGLVCHVGFATREADAIVLPALSDAAGFGAIEHHGSIRFADVDADGRDDVCARGAEGLDCWLSRGDRFGAIVRGPRWRDADGWGALSRWSTIRLADVSGDGRADVCGRGPSRFECALFEITAGEANAEPRFGTIVRGPEMADAEGWDRPEQYATIRMGDLDRDGSADLCARDRAGIACWHGSDRGFDRGVRGPALSDAAGFNRPERARTIRMADVDGDSRADLCWSDDRGLSCARTSGTGFEDVVVAPVWADSMGSRPAAGSLRIAGGGRASYRAMTGTCSATRSARPSATMALLLGLGLAFAARRGLYVRSRSTRSRTR
jgi:hypothetical protein